MKKVRHVKTIIVGGGVTGLMCAKELQKNDREDFLILTKDVGGRVTSSEKDAINYGAYFVTKDYSVLSEYISIGRKMHKRRFGFVRRGKIHSFYSVFSLIHCIPLVRVYFELRKFRRHFRAFRRRCHTLSQKEALERDAYLLRLYHKKASEEIHAFKALALVHEYFDQLGHFMAFDYPGNSTAFTMMQWASEMLVMPMYEFRLDINAWVKTLKRKIVLTEVVEIKKRSEGYEVLTKDTTYIAKYVVCATEPWVTRTLVGLRTKAPVLVSSHARYVRGVPKGPFAHARWRFIMFPSSSKMISIAKQSDGNYLVHSETKDVSLDSYFSSYHVMGERTWDPAFVFAPKALVEARHGKGLYVVGGINIEGMEDCALTGIWAARDILLQEH